MKARGNRRAQRGASPLVKEKFLKRALKVRNTFAIYSALSELHGYYIYWSRGDALRCAQRLPLAFIFVAFGAVQPELRLWGKPGWPSRPVVGRAVDPTDQDSCGLCANSSFSSTVSCASTMPHIHLAAPSKRIITFLCATSVFSVSLWLMNSEQKHTTETQRTQRLHRGNSKWIFFTANKNGVRNIYRVPAKGDGPTESVLASNEDLNLEDISRNGRLLVFNFRDEGADVPSVGLLSLPDKRRVVFAAAPARAARLSSDQKWMSYTSNRNGSVIAVRRVGPSAMPMGAEYVVSNPSRGATTSMWRAD